MKIINNKKGEQADHTFVRLRAAIGAQDVPTAIHLAISGPYLACAVDCTAGNLPAAGEVIRSLVTTVGGKGGGKADLAQAYVPLDAFPSLLQWLKVK